MSIGNKFADWCKVPPEPPRNRHKRLLAGSLIFTVLSVSLFAGLPLFNVSMIAGQTSAFAVPSVALSVANLAEGPKYIQNVTYQYVNGTEQQLTQYDVSTLQFGFKSSYSSAGELGSVNASIVNNGEENLTITAIEIYRGDTFFASVEGPFTINAHSEGFINFQVCNLRELSKSEVQWITGKQDTPVDWVHYWRPVPYTAVLKTSEGITVTDDCFMFPTAPGPETVGS